MKYKNEIEVQIKNYSRYCNIAITLSVITLIFLGVSIYYKYYFVIPYILVICYLLNKTYVTFKEAMYGFYVANKTNNIMTLLSTGIWGKCTIDEPIQYLIKYKPVFAEKVKKYAFGKSRTQYGYRPFYKTIVELYEDYFKKIHQDNKEKKYNKDYYIATQNYFYITNQLHKVYDVGCVLINKNTLTQVMENIDYKYEVVNNFIKITEKNSNFVKIEILDYGKDELLITELNTNTIIKIVFLIDKKVLDRDCYPACE